jgi:hypothetical protein
MTGLNLESFLHLLRADWAAWVSLGGIGLVLALMTWTSWGSRRVLRKCLVVSIAAHCTLILAGGRLPLGLMAVRPGEGGDAKEHIRHIRVSPEIEGDVAGASRTSGAGKHGRRLADWDRPGLPASSVDAQTPTGRPIVAVSAPLRRNEALLSPIASARATPELNPPEPPQTEERAAVASIAANDANPRVARSTQADLAEIPEVAIKRRAETERIPGRAARNAEAGNEQPTSSSNVTATREDVQPNSVPLSSETGPTTARDDSASMQRNEPSGTQRARSTGVDTSLAMPDADSAPVTRPTRPRRPIAEPPRQTGGLPSPIVISRAVPAAMPSIPGVLSPRELPEVPEVYRSRLAPNRAVLAQKAGASVNSELAVERGLDWLKRHQDADGRWNAAHSRSETKGTGSFTAHCPPGEICAGECYYYEADTAMTGLALLAYLAAGYTHEKGKYSDTVANGIRFLIDTQKPDGDLRGESKAVGMYCHAMATLALCEAYALTRDSALRDPAERAIEFIVKSRSGDGMAWRYEPGDPHGGDTSILGWIILALKSAKETGISVPADARDGALRWLDNVAEGTNRGLARYQAKESYRVTPTMTAEAWVCRQFLGTGGPGAASDEAAEYLLAHRPSRDTYNIYYWYYGTLAMYQHGGAAWTQWNAAVRDQLITRQKTTGHSAGSWEPDDDRYGVRGGRIYSTALATLTLEVYYRYLRLYDEQAAPPRLAPSRDRGSDSSIRRAVSGDSSMP